MCDRVSSRARVNGGPDQCTGVALSRAACIGSPGRYSLVKGGEVELGICDSRCSHIGGAHAIDSLRSRLSQKLVLRSKRSTKLLMVLWG